MTREISRLDASLARAGQTVTLTRIATSSLPAVSVVCKASIRGYTPQELTSDITQQDSKVILSPTQINAAGWPGAQVSGQPDVRVPSKNRGDFFLIGGVKRTVQAAVGIYLPGSSDILVRIEAQVR